MHVVEEVAVEAPSAHRIRGEIPCHLAARLDDDRVLARGMVAMTGDKLEEVDVDMDRMAHHSVVDQIDPNPLTFDEGYWFVHVRHLLTVDRPHEPLPRSEEHTSELQSLMRNSYAVFCLKKKKTKARNQ